MTNKGLTGVNVVTGGMQFPWEKFQTDNGVHGDYKDNQKSDV